jgi:N-methylhydantoinase B/oxoprolinase/acetone carboxylase alpha subunit
MHGQIGGVRNELGAMPFVRAAKGTAPSDVDQLDKAGQTILQLLHRAAGVAEENSRHAFEAAQKLLHQLRAAEDRIAELEADVAAYQERADRAEQWLHKIYTEIDSRFMQQATGAPQSSLKRRVRSAS